jgi:PAS domain S-box-containing protein
MADITIQLRSQIAALEELLQVQEQTVLQQSSELEATLESLQKSEKKFASIVDSAFDAIISADFSGNIFSWNQGAQRIFGYAQDEVLGKPLTILMPEHYRERLRQKLQRVMSSGHSEIAGKSVELQGLRKDGTEFPLELSLATWESENTKFFCGIIRDITERKQIGKELLEKRVLAEKNRQLEETTRLKSEFLANMSHELRTPLNAIIGYTSLTLNSLKTTLPAKHLQNLTNAEQASRTLLQLINDVLDFSKIEAGKMDLFIETFTLPTIFEECFVVVDGLMLNKNITFKPEIAENLPLLESDYTKVKQIVTNLLSNAIKFTTNGHVILRAYPKVGENVVKIEVEDTGCGIPQEKINTLFEVFKQLDGSIKKKFGGTGLGLAIVKKLCNILGMQIDVQSEVGKGTTFALTIPTTFQGTKNEPKVPYLSPLQATVAQPQPQPKAAEAETQTKTKTQEPPKESDFLDSLSAHLQISGLPFPAEIASNGTWYLSIPIKPCDTSNKKRGNPIHLQQLSKNGESASSSLSSSPSIQPERRPVVAKEKDKQPLGFSELSPSLAFDAKLSPYVLCLTSTETFATLQRYLAGLPLQGILVESVAQCTEKVKSHSVWAIIVEPDSGGFTTLAQLKNDERLRSLPVIMCSANNGIGSVHVGFLDHLSKPIEKEKLIEVLLRVTRLQKGDVLVVEDDAKIRDLYGQILLESGYTPHLVEDGLKALQFLTLEPLPHAILLDLLMPEMDGFSVLEVVQKNKEWQHIPIIVVTGKDLSPDERRLLQKGTQMFLEKTKFDVHELSHHIEAVIQSVELAGGRTILVVDDNEINLNLLGDIFSESGYTVYSASSGKKGIELALEKRPDAVLMDLAMPEMDGFEATQILKHNPTTRDTTIIACSAFAMSEFKEKALRAGCEGFITKPVEPKRLVEQVKKYVLSAKIKQCISRSTRSGSTENI